MKTRKQSYGSANVIGKVTETLRKEKRIRQIDMIARIQALGVDINPTSYSKLEGQHRLASDREVWAIARILEVPMERLFPEGIRQ